MQANQWHKTKKKRYKMANESIIRKIQGLLNRNEKNGATKHEAETALKMAVRLMAEYDISEFDLKKVNKDSYKKILSIERTFLLNLRSISIHLS